MRVGDRVRINGRYPGAELHGLEGTIEWNLGSEFLRVSIDGRGDYRFYPRELDTISSATAERATHTPAGGERESVMYGISEGNLITDGTSRAVVKAVTAAFIIATPENGGDEFVLALSDTNWSKVTSPLVIERRFVVYAPDGTRVDGYKFESRARRNNDARFAGEGYWLGEMKPEYFTWVPA
jgi:hypothetical protein